MFAENGPPTDHDERLSLKKIENHVRSIALHYMNCNFCRIHKALSVIPYFPLCEMNLSRCIN